MGTPLYLSEEERLTAFEAGWKHVHKGQEQVGYYIGRPHPPHTEARIVTSTIVEPGHDYIDWCVLNMLSQLTPLRGAHVMMP